MHAARVADLGPELGDDQDVRIRGEVYPAAQRLREVDEVDRCLLRLQRQLDTMQMATSYFVPTTLGFLALSAAFGIGAMAVFSTTVLYLMLMVLALVFIVMTVLLVPLIDLSDQRELMVVRERYQRRRLALASGPRGRV